MSSEYDQLVGEILNQLASGGYLDAHPNLKDMAKRALALSPSPPAEGRERCAGDFEAMKERPTLVDAVWALQDQLVARAGDRDVDRALEIARRALGVEWERRHSPPHASAGVDVLALADAFAGAFRTLWLSSVLDGKRQYDEAGEALAAMKAYIKARGIDENNLPGQPDADVRR